MTLLSRVLGFVRDLVVARAFGAGMAADAFFVAFKIPNAIGSISWPYYADRLREFPLGDFVPPFILVKVPAPAFYARQGT